MNVMEKKNSIYVPEVVTIDEIREEIQDVKTFYISFDEREDSNRFTFRSGQFVMCTVFGFGEFAVSLPAGPVDDRFHLTVRRAGKVTGALHRLRPGDKLGFRGPFGNGFPFEDIKGKNILYIAGGIGLIPLRSSIVNVLRNRNDFGELYLFYGAKNPKEIMYNYNIENWKAMDGFNTLLTIDASVPGWSGHTGFVHELLDLYEFPVRDTVAFVCGPPVMFNAVIDNLLGAGISEDFIISTLERHMKCGVGKCQHCSIGRTLVCTDGPVYTYRQIKTLGEKI